MAQGAHFLEAEGRMSTSRAVTPRCRMRAWALSRVRRLVPKPGMVRAWMLVARHIEQIERLAGDQQGQRRIEAAGDADGHGRLADVLQPLGQAGDLRLEDFLAAFAQLLLPLRHERMGIDGAAQVGAASACRCRGRKGVRTNGLVPRPSRAGVAETVGAQAIGAEAVEIDVGDASRVSRWKRGDSARSEPFSAIRQWPPKTTSVVDSQTPQEA